MSRNARPTESLRHPGLDPGSRFATASEAQEEAGPRLKAGVTREGSIRPDQIQISVRPELVEGPSFFSGGGIRRTGLRRAQPERWRGLALGSCLLVLAGCNPSVSLTVTEADPPVFALRQSGSQPCLRALGIHRLSDGQLAWRIGQHDPGACATRVTYGAVPSGYQQIGPARALVPGARYRVTITGPGFNEAATFAAPAVRPPSSAPAGPRSR